MKVLVSFAIFSVFLLVPTIAFAEGTGVGYGSITPGRLLTFAAGLIGLNSTVVAGIARAREGEDITKTPSGAICVKWV
jgi:hypothetical protein